MLDFALQTVHHVSYEYSDFNKENGNITARQLRARDAAPTNQTLVSLPTFFSAQRLKRSNVASTFDKVTRKRRKSTQDANECSSINAANPVVEFYSHSVTNASDTNQMTGRCFSPSGSQIRSQNIVHNRSQQPRSHATKRASDNNTYLPLNVPASDVTQSLHINNKRKAPANVTARCVRQRLSTGGSQSSSTDDLHNHNEQQDSHTTNGTGNNNSSLLPIAQGNTTSSRPSVDTATGLQHSGEQSDFHQSEDQSPVYEDLGDCNERCHYCKAAFWHEERLKGHRDARYHLCCGGGKIYMQSEPDPPDYIKQLLSDAAFMQHIRAYNQMFAMTSFGANIDNTVNQGRGPYVFKVSGQIYHQIGSLCPTGDDRPCFLQLMNHFTNSDTNPLDPQVVQGLIQFLDTHNELVQVFRTARDKCAENDVPEFKVRLYNGNGTRGYELPTSQAIGAIVFDSGPTTESDYDIIIEYRDGPPKRINKLHQSYMSLQFPLIFVYGQPGYHIKLMTRSADPNERMRRVSMNAFYTQFVDL
ncbi:helitron helicase-like domain-containing protein [Artemisia annua]|uniref:Helitron helicase-like domain-containing protein n=1 Tax=Artemisia annua TaxID=35608 RepID=A0A2U1KDV9_ARTAN|nr:helitron helicase-like domain-containing protein [Artemisia annua]